MKNLRIDIDVRLNRMRGFRKAALLFVIGLATALSIPPIDAWWIWGVTFPSFVYIIQANQHSTWRANFFDGWIFGCGYFLAVLHWIGFAFLVDAQNYLWMMPFAVGAMAAGLAVLWGLASVMAMFFIGRGFHSIFVFPLSFGFIEWLRGHLFTGFPWAVPGLAADGMGGVLQLASLIGMNGLTLLVLLWALMPLAFLQGERNLRIVALIIAACLPAAWIWGEWRVVTAPKQFIAGPVVRLVQPNISQNDKWRGDNARAIFDQLLRLSAQPAVGAEPTLIVWPESAVPFLIDESAEGKRELRTVLDGRKTLLTGAVRRTWRSETQADYYTSILEFDGQAQLVGTYDKHHLVPGGEYLPLAWLIEPLGFRKIVNLPESFKAGTGPSTLPVQGAGLAEMQICYEAIFPHSFPNADPRPDWVLNVTNDGWFGNSAGPYQHLAQLRMRAVEQGLGIIRVANTGISAVLDSTGGYVMQSRVGEATAFDSPIPKALPPTFFARWGELGFALLWSLLIVGANFLGRKTGGRS